MTRAGTGYADSRRRWSRKAATAAVLVVGALTMAACSSGTDSNLQTAPSKPKSPTTSSTANPNLPAGTASTQQAVLNAWLAR
jgi:ABC-type phosphate transport system substrate-binding protein